MLFNSYIFILLFLPLTVTGYWLINRLTSIARSQVFLIIMSVWFYSYLNWKYLPALGLNIFVNFTVYKFLKKYDDYKKRKVILILGLLFNIGSLCYYKYLNFFIDNINQMFHSDITLNTIILPLGISYIVFQQIAFIVDTYRNETGSYSLREYLIFVIYFPKIISGPIILHEEFFPQLADKNKQILNWDNIARGGYLFAIGLAKKVLLADVFGKVVDYAYGIIAENGVREFYAIDLLIVIFSYTLQLYFDFSGYCDMAMGVSKMFNIDLPINFNSPYKALTITEFWKRWHITLTRFLTKYIYIPLGGNRKGKYRTYVNILVVFIISGLWHGTGWTFLIWGLMHGLYQVMERVIPDLFKKMHPVLSWFITFGFINIAWVFFRADNVNQAVSILVQLARMSFTSLNDGIVELFNLPELVWISQYLLPIDILHHYKYLFCFSYLAIGFIGILGRFNSYEKCERFKDNFCNVMFVSVIMVWCLFSFSGVSTFLYWEF